MIFFIAMLRKFLYQRLVFRWTIIFEIISTTSMLGVFFLIDKFQASFFGETLSKALLEFKTSYFGYVALGLAISSFAHSSFGAVLGQLYEDKRQNIFEQIIASPITLRKWAITAGGVNVLSSSFHFLLIFSVAIGILQLKVPQHNFLLSLSIILLSIIPLWALSIFSLASTLIFRRGDPISYVMAIAFEILSGVYVPVSIFPEKIQLLSNLIPLTPTVRALQSVVYKGANFSDIQSDFFWIIGLTCFYLPLALLLLKWLDVYARRKGTYFLT